jgi:hypothetical protein
MTDLPIEHTALIGQVSIFTEVSIDAADCPDISLAGFNRCRLFLVVDLKHQFK